jgi:Tol biopolymer transport system component
MDFHPSWSPTGKKIVFERARMVIDRRSGECCLTVGSDLYTIRADGSGLRRIRGSGQDGEPAWSPDNRLIVFSRRNRLYTARLDGTGARVLHRDNVEQHWPAWSSDGTKIAFWRGRLGQGAIYVVGVDGHGFTRVAERADPYGGASWSPDGARLAFGRDLNIYVVGADGSNARVLAGGRFNSYYEPSWSPNGRRLAFRSDAGIYVMRADGSGIHRITRAHDEVTQDHHPIWSPSGRRIVFSGYRGRAEEARIFKVAPTGRALQKLTSAPSG